MSDTNDILRKLAARQAARPRFPLWSARFERRRPQSSQQPFRVARSAAARRRRPCARVTCPLPVRSHAASPPLRRAQSSPTPCAAAWEGRAVDNDALSGLLNDPEALQNALRSVSSLLGASDAGGAPDAVSPADDPEAQLLPVITGIMQSGRAAVRPEKRRS